jgi:hypothetical protein
LRNTLKQNGIEKYIHNKRNYLFYEHFQLTFVYLVWAEVHEKQTNKIFRKGPNLIILYFCFCETFKYICSFLWPYFKQFRSHANFSDCTTIASENLFRTSEIPMKQLNRNSFHFIFSKIFIHLAWSIIYTW